MKKLEKLSPITYKLALKKRKQELERLIKIKQSSVNQSKELENAGHIRICQHYNKNQFYLISKKGDSKGKYLPKEKTPFAISLIKYQYDKKALESMEKELTLIKMLLSNAEHYSVETINKSFSKTRQSIANVLTLSNEEYTKLWTSVPYKKNQYDFGNTKFYTMNNEQVRSKSEVIIANLLKQKNIPYRYEYPIFLQNINITIYPDFCCLNLQTREEIYWEHFGLMDNQEYAQKAFRKMQIYTENGFLPGKNIIYTFETSLHSMNIHEVEILISSFLE